MRRRGNVTLPVLPGGCITTANLALAQYTRSRTFMEMKLALASLAVAFATSVFPHPGGLGRQMSGYMLIHFGGALECGRNLRSHYTGGRYAGGFQSLAPARGAWL